jgi:branched-chain amino acid aminotransferase
MDHNCFIIHNGLIKKLNQPIFTINNRAFSYADGFFESIFAFNTHIPFLNLHLERIKQAFTHFSITPNPIFNNITQLKEIILYLARKNKLYKAYRIKIIIFRNYGGLYLPDDNSSSYIIQTYPLQNPKPPEPKNGLLVDIAENIYKDFSQISKFKSISSLPVLASIYAKNNNLDDVIILNHNNNIVETSNSNIFLFINNKLYTPKLEEGPVQGIMRHILISMANELKIDVIEDAIPISRLFDAHEFIITNAISGIRFIKAYKTKRYLNIITNELYQLLIKNFFQY